MSHVDAAPGRFTPAPAACYKPCVAETRAPNAPGEEVIDAVVDSVTFRSEDARFSVLRMSRTPAREDTPHFVAVGDLGRSEPGEMLRLRGVWHEHPRYGRRLRVRAFSPLVPTSTEGLVRYLGSGAIPGVGPETAQRLVKRFGDRVLEVAATQSDKLREVEGIGKARARSIAEAIRAKREDAETMAFLHGLGLGPALARRVRERYEDDTTRVVSDDPYMVAEQVRGVGFKTADQMGRALEIASDDPRRAAGAALHLLGTAADDGHVFMTLEDLEQGADSLDVPRGLMAPALAALTARGVVIEDRGAFYPPPLYRAELDVAERLVDLARPRKPPADLARALSEAHDDALTETQRSAVSASLLRGALVLTGGPGTGKTTTVRAIVRAHQALGRRVALCAPTGRAAKRLAETTELTAKTIHRTLEWNPAHGSFRRDRQNPIEADLVLVDEASMLDMRLAQSLLNAVDSASSIVLVGDVDQLPPVSPGQVLRETIASGVVETIRLREVFRQAQQSAIVRGAHAILHGRMPEATPAGTRGDGDLFMIPARTPEELQDKLLATIERAAQAYDLDPKRDLQVLSPMRRGPAGVDQLNARLQEALNPAPPDGSTSRRAGPFRPGDKVMQLRNDYERDVYNGDLGEVTHVEGPSVFVTIDGREVQYQPKHLEDLTLAFASTIHKVQGSEFPAVVIVLHTSHFILLSRALIYTAVTRARRLVVLLGDPRALARAVRNAVSYDTHSRLAERLTALGATPAP